MDRPRSATLMRRPASLRGVPPRYQVFDRRKSPPMSVGRFYAGALGGPIVFEVYDDHFREFLKREEPFTRTHFDWMLDVPVDAPMDARGAVIVPDPVPAPVCRGQGENLTLPEAVDGVSAPGFYRVVRTSDPV